MTEFTALLTLVLVQGIFGAYLNRRDAFRWSHPEAIPGLATRERAEFVALQRLPQRTPREQVRHSMLEAQVDSDLSGLGMEPAEVPALRRLGWS